MCAYNIKLEQLDAAKCLDTIELQTRILMYIS